MATCLLRVCLLLGGLAFFLGASSTAAPGDRETVARRDAFAACFADPLPLSAWRKLAAFHEAGGKLILLGAKPRNTTTEFPSSDAINLADRLLSGTDRTVLLDAHGAVEAVRWIDKQLKPDLTVPNPDDPIRMTRRTIGAWDVWFVINDSSASWSGPVTLPVQGSVQVCDPDTGTIREEPGPIVRLALPAYGASVLRWRSETPGNGNPPTDVQKRPR